MIFVFVYILSLSVVLSFLFLHDAGELDGGAIVVAMAFIPVLNIMLAFMCILTCIEEYLWND